MSDQDKIESLAEVFEVEAGALSPETSLDSLNWDSMAMLAVMALSKARGKGITGTQVRAVETIGDIMAYL